MELVAAPGQGLDELAGLLPGPEDDLDLPTHGVEAEEFGGLHECGADVSDDDVPAVTSQHVLIRLLAELIRKTRTLHDANHPGTIAVAKYVWRQHI